MVLQCRRCLLIVAYYIRYDSAWPCLAWFTQSRSLLRCWVAWDGIKCGVYSSMTPIESRKWKAKLNVDTRQFLHRGSREKNLSCSRAGVREGFISFRLLAAFGTFQYEGNEYVSGPLCAIDKIIGYTTRAGNRAKSPLILSSQFHAQTCRCKIGSGFYLGI